MSIARWILVGFLMSSLVACGGEDAPAEGTPDAAQVTGITATVTYTGTASGALTLAAFTSMPPAGPPVSFAQKTSPTFPLTLSLENMAPGTYYVLALLDVAPASPTQPGPEDRQGWSQAVQVADRQNVPVSIAVMD